MREKAFNGQNSTKETSAEERVSVSRTFARKQSIRVNSCKPFLYAIENH